MFECLHIDLVRNVLGILSGSSIPTVFFSVGIKMNERMLKTNLTYLWYGKAWKIGGY